MRVLIAGGGTGGHLYPGIALARELQRRDPATVVTFVGTAQGVEARVVPREGFPLELIRVAGLKGKSRVERLQGLRCCCRWRRWTRGAWCRRSGRTWWSASAALPRVRCSLLAALRGYPTMLLEQNALPGITNRLLARGRARRGGELRGGADVFSRARDSWPAIRCGPSSFRHRPRRRMTRRNSPRDAARVLIFGGSQGAHAINVAMVEAAARLAAAGIRLAITHQTGERDLDLVRDAYQRAGLEARVEAFLFEMDREMKAAGLVICRAGATTLAELAAAGTPAILVPLPTATDDHQRKNAEVVAQAGAAEVIEERELTGDSLAAAITGLIGDVERAAADGDAARGAGAARRGGADCRSRRGTGFATAPGRGWTPCSVRRGASTSSASVASG